MNIQNIKGSFRLSMQILIPGNRVSKEKAESQAKDYYPFGGIMRSYVQNAANDKFTDISKVLLQK